MERSRAVTQEDLDAQMAEPTIEMTDGTTQVVAIAREPLTNVREE